MGTSLTATGVQFPDNSVQSTPAFTGFRNRIINGDMKIAQRGTSFPAAASGTYPVDRFQYVRQESTTVNTLIQSTDVPLGIGLSNSLRATVTTADTSIAAGDLVYITQRVEGYNTVDLVGVPITLSFWVKSSKTGIHCIAFRNYTYNSSYISEYTINSANTWEKKFITISTGLPSIGTWNYTNGIGLFVAWIMACESTYRTSNPNNWIATDSMATNNQVNCLDTVGNIFAITGVQLERGSVATDFEQRPYGLELLLCQRYYEVIDYIICMVPWSSGSQVIRFRVPFAVEKRSTPVALTLSAKDGGTGSIGFANNGTRSVVMYASGNYQDVISYPYMTISAEL